MRGEFQEELLGMPQARKPHPMVVHCKRTRFDVYIGRGNGSIWGNPFEIGKDGSREEVIAKYRAWILGQPELMRRLPELRGEILGCWCSPKPCHGEVLAELAHMTPEATSLTSPS